MLIMGSRLIKLYLMWELDCGSRMGIGNMRVLIVTDACVLDGGIAKVVLDSVRLLRAKGVDVTIFSGGGEVDANFRGLGVRIVTCGQYELKDTRHRGLTMVKGLWNWTIARRLRELLSEFDPRDTVVHVHAWSKILSPSVFCVLRRSGFKTVMTCHGFYLGCPNAAQYDYQRQRVCELKGCGLKCLLRNCDARCYAHKVWRWIRQRIVLRELDRFRSLCLVSISDRECGRIRAQIGEGHEFIRINNPIAFRDASSPAASDRDAYVFVGRVSAEKAPRLFAEAVRRAGVRGMLIGDGEDLLEIKRDYSGIECVGWKTPDEINLILRSRARALVFPSVLYEGAPLTPLEAMAVGVPCIISDVTNAVEYVEDGVTGLLFKSGDVEDLKRKIVMMKDSVFRGMLSENIRKRFDISKWSEATHIEKLMLAYVAALKE